MSLLLKAARSTTTLGVRRSSVMHGSALPQAARAQVAKPAEPGFYEYTRNWSRDKTFDLSKAPQKGDTPMYFFLRRLGHAYEAWPLFWLTAAWFGVFCFAVYKSFVKMEIWLDRSKTTAPWDWSRVRDKYWTLHTVAFESVRLFNLPKQDTHKRLEIMEVLQDEMIEAAKKRGTRK